ncbi:fimbrial assembly chaperone [Klebsiella oxytoca]|uniref:fimbrial assembly chaperone n=1 Tax=Klebsiella oxytoca TaxID=571 RepID=UPI0013D0EA18|nr:fimbrial assembly chaperone [Klebsiella oxytoca]EKW2356004.1 fimbrial assembly chaperone [Klebsiella oxytoca]EKW2422449.1 fimbrial assembly chaperone [Klebsiella oxytoca]ELK0739265.1 fimbrial assembly chaperone [Klebsiella oxytoca]ELX8409009.1 fimbrial assembly chaperone [Klebsiella oxytoca]MBZ7696518.1 fimbrial assembly chaperone [Klebsiella oxytoca]
MRSYRQWLVFSKAVLALLLLAGVNSAPFAAVNVDRTRLVFAANDIAQSLTLANDSVTPMLLQVWTDAGETASSPDSSRTPLVVLPPVFKMQPDELRTLRVMLSSRRSLPEDRESLFWLNIYQIPPELSATKSATRKLVLPLRLRLKVFIRPTGLKAPTANDEQKLRFSIASQGITITNPTPWYMSLTVTATKGIRIGYIMLAPYERRDVVLSQAPAVGTTVNYAVINDSGNWRTYTATIMAKKES